MRRQFELGGWANVGEAIKNRRARQDAIYNQAHPPELLYIVGEAALYRDMGAPDVLLDQLEYVQKLGEQPFVTIRVMPFDTPVPSQVGGFSVLRFDSLVMTDFALVEHVVGAVVVDEEDSLRAYSRKWELISSGATTEHDSREKIQARIDHYKSRLGRR